MSPLRETPLDDTAPRSLREKVERACTSKRKFDSKKEAKSEAARARGSTGKRLAVYECQYCHGWHLAKKKTNARYRRNQRLYDAES